VAGTLRLIREGVGMELRRGSFEVTLDGETVASIGRGGTAEAPLEPGHHRLQIRAGRYSSRRYEFDSADGDVINLRCHGAMMWPRYVASIVKPDLAISLHRE
jgi:hypothetical protein